MWMTMKRARMGTRKGNRVGLIWETSIHLGMNVAMKRNTSLGMGTSMMKLKTLRNTMRGQMGLGMKEWMVYLKGSGGGMTRWMATGKLKKTRRKLAVRTVLLMKEKKKSGKKMALVGIRRSMAWRWSMTLKMKMMMTLVIKVVLAAIEMMNKIKMRTARRKKATRTREIVVVMMSIMMKRITMRMETKRVAVVKTLTERMMLYGTRTLPLVMTWPVVMRSFP